jgi:ABC-type polysaccharide/polyol phosphate export permease
VQHGVTAPIRTSIQPERRGRPLSFVAGAGLALLEGIKWRHLIVRLARAELRRENARLILGSVWWVADPLLQMLVYWVLVGVLLGRTADDYPLFVLTALMAWKGVSATIGASCNAVIGNERIVRQMSFPRIVLPLARVMSQSWRLLVALGVQILLMLVLWPHRVTAELLWLPLLFAVQLTFVLPAAIVLSAATVFVRDLANLVRHLLRLGLYLSPVLYGLEVAEERLPSPISDIYQLNPLALLLDGYRNVGYDGIAPTASSILLPLGVGLVLVGPALAWFRRCEPNFAKVL